MDVRKSISILFFLLVLWLLPFALAKENSTLRKLGSRRNSTFKNLHVKRNNAFAKLDMELTPRVLSNRQKELEDLVMSPSKSFSQFDLMTIPKSCSGIGMRCKVAEDCCTRLCLKRFKECVF